MSQDHVGRGPDVAEKAERNGGRRFTPGESGYDELRRPWNLSVEQRPAVIVEPHDVHDVREALVLAKSRGLGVAIQATGHGIARLADGAMLIVTRQLRRVDVDPAGRKARIEAGCTWGPVLEQAQAHGLAPLLGSAPHVGAVGYTLGGGLGWLARRYGLAADAVRSYEVVTTEGEFLLVNGSQHADLFWALRGGGRGSMAVVTAMEVDLVAVSKIYDGSLLYPASDAREVMTRYRDWIVDMPEEMTSSVVLFNFPPLETVPEPLRGQSFVMARGCHCGSPAEPLRLRVRHPSSHMTNVAVLGHRRNLVSDHAAAVVLVYESRAALLVDALECACCSST